jgi:hypothetical protein
MDNFYEIVILEEPKKLDKDRIFASPSEFSSPKSDKFPSPEHTNFSPVKPADRAKFRQPTDAHLIDARIILPKKPLEIKELDRSSVSKVPFLPLLSIRTNALEELYKELKELKLSIAEQEERHKISQQCIETGKVKIQELEDRHSYLKKKAGIGCSYEECKEELNRKLKSVKKNWKASSKKLRERIGELEEEEKEVRMKLDGVRNMLFRKGQQQNRLKKSLNDSGANGENGHHSCDLLNSSVQTRSVTHTPSWNSLYGS